MSRLDGESVRHKGAFTAHIRTTKDAARALRELSGWRSFGSLLRDYGHVSKSMAGWHGWLTGQRVPTLGRLIDVVEAFGGELVIRRRQRPHSMDARN